MYIIDHNKQLSLVKEMKQLRRNTQSCEVYYHHPFTNQMWKSFFPRAKEDNLGPKLLRHEPLPNTIEACLDICLAEDAPENAIGLGIEWSTKATLWPEVIKILEENYSDYLRGQLKLFLKHLDMEEAELGTIKETSSKPTTGNNDISGEEIDNLIWRSRKIRMKRFFVLG
ncbi:hypothetical protein [Fodinibius salsisoli]|uniref:Uncharacterized protein n=1 Tax=Fodinibius salsisoli TaxID=2820877 RepID=A0ABT3PMQ5_9BACT|nr:hypothetical protein [Fodinibius salsisoli]MCW9707140.1 hypothetical protein [Fodinibius salsisoli]